MAATHKKYTGDTELDAKIEQWMLWDKNEKTRSEINGLVDKKDIDELKKIMMKRISFGTAGLRAKMGAGFACMNELIIIQATQGILRYLQTDDGEKLKAKGVVVGYDGRHNSKRFAELVATIYVHAGVPVYLYSRMCATPYVPYAVSYYGCRCGVMVTASHNPKDDNGYKVYWHNGAQIVSPYEKYLSDSINNNLEPWKTSWDTSVLKDNPLVRDPYQTVYTEYNKDLQSLCFHKSQNQKSPLKFTFTAMHGVGYPFTSRSLEVFGFSPPIPVKEQVEADPNFPTVKYPNPEEGEGALKLAMKTADENQSSIILANDPDADRLAVAEKVDGKWKIFSGNELGALFGWWLVKCYKEKHPNKSMSDVYMLASTVSSKILKAIALKENFNFVETLTGFKWMGSESYKLMQQGKQVLFAFEEAIGFMCGSKVLDKDGVSAAAVIAEMATSVCAEGKTLSDQLEQVYSIYGHHLSINSYFLSYDSAATDRMFADIRNYEGTGTYPKSCGRYAIKGIRDLTTGYDSSTEDGVPLLPTSKSSHVITFTFECGCIATLRTSGTEPKIKYYTEHCPSPSRGLGKSEVLAELQDIVSCIENVMSGNRAVLEPSSSSAGGADGSPDDWWSCRKSTFQAPKHCLNRSAFPSGIVDHVNSLSENIGDLIKKPEFCDIVLCVEGINFKCHKVILAARSEYFRALLYGGMLESQPGTKKIELQNTSAVAFYDLCKYMYTGRINLVETKEENLLDILGLAHQYGFVELEGAISDYLKATLNIQNVCLIYDLANMYSLTSLSYVCKEFIDRNALEILSTPSFCSLSESSVKELLSRDSFCAQEIKIFHAVCKWCDSNPSVDRATVLQAVRLPLISIKDLFEVVRPSNLVTPNAILDAIQVIWECRGMDLKYRGFLVPDENVATISHGAQVIRGEMRTALLDGDTVMYDFDRGFTRHHIDDNSGQGIVIELGQPYIINTIKMLLWDRDMRSYSYYIEVSMDDKDYQRIIDHTKYLCRSWQTLHFPAKVVRYIKIAGSHNTVNRVFHVVSMECSFTNHQFVLHDGLIVPQENVATIKSSACVIEGVSRSRNALINGDVQQYDWDSGYTCHQLGSGAIVVQLAQPYMCSSMRLLLWDCDDRCYSYYIEVSIDQQHWVRVADKQQEACKSWQTIVFDRRPVAFVKIVGTRNTANEVFHCVHFECPAEGVASGRDSEGAAAATEAAATQSRESSSNKDTTTTATTTTTKAETSTTATTTATTTNTTTTTTTTNNNTSIDHTPTPSMSSPSPSTTPSFSSASASSCSPTNQSAAGSGRSGRGRREEVAEREGQRRVGNRHDDDDSDSDDEDEEEDEEEEEEEENDDNSHRLHHQPYAHLYQHRGTGGGYEL
ncbi:BTB/POZ domain-containing protein 9-like [Argonauta hians]